jgi:hypothetical protein
MARAREYAVAFQALAPDISNAQWAMLAAFLAEQTRTQTASQLAHAAGYPSFSTANSMFGRLGHMFADQMGLTVNRRRDGSEVWTTALAVADTEAQGPEWRWTLRPEVAVGLRLATPSLPSDVRVRVTPKAERDFPAFNVVWDRIAGLRGGTELPGFSPNERASDLELRFVQGDATRAVVESAGKSYAIKRDEAADLYCIWPAILLGAIRRTEARPLSGRTSYAFALFNQVDAYSTTCRPVGTAPPPARPLPIASRPPSAPEGALRLGHIGFRERSRAICGAALEANRQRFGGLECEACGYRPGEDQRVPSGRERQMLDVHHVERLASGERVTTIEGLVVLCPLCHRRHHVAEGERARR